METIARVRHRAFPRGLLLLALGAPVFAACAGAPGADPRPGTGPEGGAIGEIENVILFIGDGAGVAYWTAAKLAAGELAVEEMPVTGITDTRSSDSYVTDSAAGATVYASGVRTYNGAIGVGPGCPEMVAADTAAVLEDPAACDPLETVFDLAHPAGIATGLVATSSITHATPASFGAKVPYRSMEAEIAEQLAGNPIDVLLGGGRGFFDGQLRADSVDLLEGLCREAACPATAEELRTHEPDDRRLVGLFAENQMAAAGGREPTLPEMTRAALRKLDRSPDGFFLVVEGSQPDWRGHGNEPLPDVAAEMVDFDEAVGVGLDFAREHPATLILVVADHETGGLSLVQEADSLVAAYTTGSHTAEMTPHFAFGPGAERFAGLLENREIGGLLMEISRGLGTGGG